MSVINAQVAKLICDFEFNREGHASLKSMLVDGAPASLRMEFHWPWTAPVGLRDDLAEFLVGLMGQCFPCGGPADQSLQAENFLAQLPGLRFENLQATRQTDGTGVLQLRCAFDQFSSLLTHDVTQKHANPLDDVFLPLTNLSAYLHAMKDQTGADGPSRAAELTAGRIDEFLLIYGQRLQDADGQSRQVNSDQL